MNGNRNMWIKKPDSGHEGQGITIHNDYESIIESVKSSKNRMMIVMKRMMMIMTDTIRMRARVRMGMRERMRMGMM